MTQQAIRGALQTQLMTLGWADQTAFENDGFTPTTGTPFQQVNTLFADPNTYGVLGEDMERGVFQVTLKYPIGGGAGASTARAEAIRAAFAPPMTLPPGRPQVVKISARASIARQPTDDDRDVTVVRIRFTER